jgi:predicted transcriptional regulator
MRIDWDAIAEQAQKETDKHFKNKISALTKLTDTQVLDLINDTGISKEDLVKVLKTVDDSVRSNEAKAKAIRGINKGVDFLVAVASKFVGLSYSIPCNRKEGFAIGHIF